MYEKMKNTTQIKTAQFEATITWTFEAQDHVVAQLSLSTKQGQLAHIKRRVELIPRMPQRIKLEHIWVSLNLVERQDESALYASYPDPHGKPQYELIAEHSKHRPQLRLIHSASA